MAGRYCSWRLPAMLIVPGPGKSAALSIVGLKDGGMRNGPTRIEACGKKFVHAPGGRAELADRPVRPAVGTERAVRALLTALEGAGTRRSVGEYGGAPALSS
jgi:hypothetical protein